MRAGDAEGLYNVTNVVLGGLQATWADRGQWLLHSCSLIKLCFQLFCCGTESRAKIINILGFVPRPGSRHPRTLGCWLLGTIGSPQHHISSQKPAHLTNLAVEKMYLKDIKDLLH